MCFGTAALHVKSDTPAVPRFEKISVWTMLAWSCATAPGSNSSSANTPSAEPITCRRSGAGSGSAKGEKVAAPSVATERASLLSPPDDSGW
eukprot:CAMPEP_0180306118 /NCGR_PEP_ID=MMETSP0988-20121125/26838_1 /TAXON_ID=697907 /ORGANISM="non described non described, Strain CCMP2293" /LENGTH=90 /DNA_ID=CAMNT_0022288695 /DNA_START=249 /DNA_END=521 /DNA_ORIENTATION=-